MGRFDELIIDEKKGSSLYARMIKKAKTKRDKKRLKRMSIHEKIHEKWLKEMKE